MYPVQALGVRQSKMETALFSVDISDASTSAWTVAGIDEGSKLATIKKTATGTTSIKFANPTRRVPILLGMPTPIGHVDIRFSVTSVSATELVLVSEVNGTDTDCDYHLAIALPYRETEQ